MIYKKKRQQLNLVIASFHFLIEPFLHLQISYKLASTLFILLTASALLAKAAFSSSFKL